MHPHRCLHLASCPSCPAQPKAGPLAFHWWLWCLRGPGVPWQEDAARSELSAGCSHCVFENLHSHLCYYCLSGRQATRFAFHSPTAPTSGCLPQEHALLCAFPGRGPDPLFSHARTCVRTQFCVRTRFCVHVVVVREQERQQAAWSPSVSARWRAGGMHVVFTSHPGKPAASA